MELLGWLVGLPLTGLLLGITARRKVPAPGSTGRRARRATVAGRIEVGLVCVVAVAVVLLHPKINVAILGASLGLSLAGLATGRGLSVLLPADTPWRAEVGVGGIALGLFLLATLTLGLLFLSKLRERDNRENCAFNLHQIGIALLEYADRNGGAFPPTLASLITDPHVDFRVRALVCPSTTDSPAPGATPDQQAHAIQTEPGHLSYVYAGKGLTNQATAATVLAYDNPHNHGDAGIEVLFGDGHVEFLDKARADRMKAELQSGHNPPQMR